VSQCPEHVPADRIVDFDPHTDPYDYEDMFDTFEQFRGKPLQFSARYGGFWIATDAETIRGVYDDPALFSSRQTSIPTADAWPRALIPIELDPPVHTQFRRTLAAAFSPRAAAELDGPIRDSCARSIRRFIDAGSCDFVTEFARTMPTEVFIEHLFGFPREMTGEFVRWSFTLLHGESAAERRVQGQQLVELLSGTIEERAKRREGDDIISHLLDSDIDGRKLTREEILDTAFLLFIAGLDTVTTSLSFAFNFLARHPEHRRQIIDEPTLIPQAVEELLRYHAFVSNTRTVTRDSEYHGIQLKAGDRMHLPGACAARDEREFEQPDAVIFRRRPNRHMAFGFGAHRCLGIHLARRELAVALSEWHDQIPDYEIDESKETVFHAGTMLGMKHLPLTWA
jgi:cytochrome P450